MKIRNGFVSNSSSSSFTCEISGNNESGYDISLRDCCMVECEGGHIMMDSYVTEYMQSLLNKHGIKHLHDMLTKSLDDMSEDGYGCCSELDRNDIETLTSVPDIFTEIADGYDQIPSSFCPICTLVSISRNDIVPYLLARSGMTRDDIVAEVRGKFESYDDFQKYFRGY